MPALTGVASVVPTSGTFSIWRCRDSNLPRTGQGILFASASHVALSCACARPAWELSSSASFIAAAAFLDCSWGSMASMAWTRAISSGVMAFLDPAEAPAPIVCCVRGCGASWAVWSARRSVFETDSTRYVTKASPGK